MKKNTLKEDLLRIHELTYGKEILKEQSFLSKLFGGGDKKPEQTSKVDEPKKADLVSSDVADFYKNIEDSIKSGGFTQQQSGSISFQKGVESMQIGLMLLGYELPKHGVDGLFGGETAAAVSKFITDKMGGQPTGKTINETVKIVPQGGGIIGKPGQGTHSASDWQSGNAWDVTGPVGSDVISITTGTVDKVRKSSGGLVKSGVKKIYGDQISIKSSDGKPDVFYTHIDTSLKVGDSVKEGDVVGKIMQIDGIPSHVHVGLSSGNLNSLASGITDGGGSTIGPKVNASPEMLTKLVGLLKERGVTSEELKKYIDASVTTGGGANFTDLDLTTTEGFGAYAQICQKFIENRPPNLLGITGVMMAEGAKAAFDNHRKYVPPELALAQLAAEGGIGNKDPQSRPIRTKNPFNVGNVDSGANVEHGSVQSGINTYYNLIAKDYLVKGKTASDLVKSFVNKNGSRYATAAYEPVISKIAGEANRIAAPIYASLSKKPTTDTSSMA